MSKKKDEAKELWPGAVLWLDLKDRSTLGAWDKIEAHIDSLASTADKIVWLKKFLILYEEALRKRIEDAFRDAPLEYEDRAKAIRMDSEVLKKRVREKLETLEAWRETEKREELDQRYQAEQEAATSPAPIKEPTDEPSPWKWDNLPAAVALCALLRAAGMPAGISDRAVGKFAKLLTGRSDKKMAAAYHNAVFGAFSDDHAKVVADALTELGLDKAAADIRRKFQKDEI